ncbi:hypothetical protein PUNSTDRAFT_42561 [Punctularia strigosozonata HHB-11173 SS5]|uniref:uncharacterized protein n=1 Tax=Punctularia strigosozonata (strain HHB-11173) TaxID=741275 RepID=UPI0004417DD8|nr:uncharacterized protein PUNSTDRAFT_42561 [Punctularia strigosozonata HHB-11173 SS5]EIN11239.1 hypothetical protein PUNSTDRAFT_42561 [Punctularia strigosozonata HHB-11173 SS5]
MCVCAPCCLMIRLIWSQTQETTLPASQLHGYVYLARALISRHQFVGDQQDLIDGFTLAKKAVIAADAQFLSCPTVMVLSASVYIYDAGHRGNAEHWQIGDDLCRKAIALLPDKHLLHAGALRAAAIAAQRLFETTGQCSHIDDAVNFQRSALEIASLHKPPDYPHYFSVLGLYLRMRSEALGDPRDLDEAVSLTRTSVDLCPASHVFRKNILTKLSQALVRRFERDGQTADIREAYEVAKQALSAGLSSGLYALDTAGGILTRLIEVTDVTDSDIDQILAWNQEALQLCPPGHHVRNGYIGNVADSLRLRFFWRGSLADLEESIELQRQLVHRFPRGTTVWRISMGSLADTLAIRFKELGHVNDLSEAIALHHEAYDATTITNPIYQEYYLSMVSTLCLRFETEGTNREDLVEAIAISSQMLNHLPTDHSLIYQVALAHSNALTLRARDTESLDDACQAVHLLTQYATRVPPDSVHGTRYRIALGSAYLIRYHIGKGVDDAQAAKAVYSELLVRLTPGRQDRFQCLLNMSDLYLEARTPFHDMHAALDHLYEAISDDGRDVRSRLQGSLRVLSSIKVSSVDEASVKAKLLDTYSKSLSLLPRVAYFGLNLDSRLRSLAAGQRLTPTCASLALQLSQPETAVEMLEQGRAIFWAHALRLRSRFDDVPERYRTRLLELAQRLERNADISDAFPDPRHVDQAASLRRKQSEEFNSLLDDIRFLPGFDRFMLHDRYSTLAKAAREGPVVVLIASPDGSHAIIVQRSGVPIHVPLPITPQPPAFLKPCGTRSYNPS